MKMKTFEEHMKDAIEATQAPSTAIDGQQMFEMLGVVANAVATLQQAVARIVEVQDKQNSAILTLSNDVECIVENLKQLSEHIKTNN